jgi:hypothetical protein
LTVRDYLAWHDDYDNPSSGLPWRLSKVRAYLRSEFDERPGPLRVLSMCAGDGRDVLGVLGETVERAGGSRVDVTLVELHPQLAATARQRGEALGDRIGHFDVRAVDAGNTDAYAGAVPADVFVMVGVFGNITDADIERTVDAIPMLCADGALVLWSRGLVNHPDNDAIRARLAATGCTEIDYAQLPSDDGGATSVGAVRFTGTPQPLPAGQHLFTFVN